MLVLLLACVTGPNTASVEAFRGAPAYWPENSRTAIAGVVREGFDGVFLDLSLTVDGVPVVFRGPTVDPGRCTLADGSPIEVPPEVSHLSVEELTEDYLCGGLPQPGFANAVLRAEPPLTLAEALGLLRESPRTAIRAQVDTADLATAVLARWTAQDPPNDLILSGADPSVLRDAEGAFAAANIDVITALGGGTSTDALLWGLDALVVDAYSIERPQVSDLRLDGVLVWAEAAEEPADVFELGADVTSVAYPGDIP